jgi:hypothetical protein
MIRHVVTQPLEALIAAENAGWLAGAAARTEELRSAGRWDDGRKTWSEIKGVYRRLQHDKCAFCERRLGGQPYGAVEHDVEHFRPKAAVKAWPPQTEAKKRRVSYRFATGDAWDEGYYLLAFHPWNYVTACKTCNSALKRSYFPVAGARISGGEDPRRMKSEKPFLVYPLGDMDDDPETLITFRGSIPVPRFRSGVRHRRASVVIDFFRLDIREELLWERSDRIVSLFMALRMAEGGSAADRALGERNVALHLSPYSPHTNCARAFRTLYDQDRDEAGEIADLAQAYLDSHSRP